MYNRLISYLNFLWHSKNEHGVHSPFIFKYVTQCLYSKNNHSKNKIDNIVLKSLAYFKCKSITVVPPGLGFESQIKRIIPSILLENKSPEMIFIKDCNKDVVQTYLYDNNNIENDTVIILGNIYKTKSSALLWKEIKDCKKITVTVDMYHCAAIFFRKEQVEEHFKIRI